MLNTSPVRRDTPGRGSVRDGSEPRRYVEQALADNDVLELRMLSAAGVRSGVFNDPGALIAAAAAAEGNAYIGLNAMTRPTRVTNHLARAARGSAVGDDCIARYTRIAVDVDPVRPRGLNSTREELMAAHAVRGTVMSFLDTLGWPPPTLGMSGNGYHAIYRCKVTVSEDTRALMRALYRGLAKRFSTPAAAVDPTLHNPSRILRLYGTVNRKGPDLPERPQRLAMCALARDWRCVTLRQIKAAADALTAKPAPKVELPPRSDPVARAGGTGGDYATLDAVAFLRYHGLYKRALGAGKHSLRCPWIAEHSDEDWFDRTDTVIWEAVGGAWPQFFCSHAHCADRRTIDVIRHLGNADQFCSRRSNP